MELKTKYPILAMPVVLLVLVATTTSVYAWDSGYVNNGPVSYGGPNQ